MHVYVVHVSLKWVSDSGGDTLQTGTWLAGLPISVTHGLRLHVLQHSSEGSLLGMINSQDISLTVIKSGISRAGMLFNVAGRHIVPPLRDSTLPPDWIV